MALVPFKLPFDCCTGGQAQAQAAYEEAFNACFNLGLDAHRQPISHISSKTGEHKWSMMEMWPMTVSSQLETHCVALQAKLSSQSCQTATHTKLSTRLAQDLKSIHISACKPSSGCIASHCSSANLLCYVCCSLLRCCCQIHIAACLEKKTEKASPLGGHDASLCM